MARQYYPPELKKTAQTLRTNGVSFKDIGKQLSVAKSTARAWTKDVRLSPAAKKRLYTAGMIKMTTGSNNARNRRLTEIEEIILKAKQEINEPINDSAFKLLGAMLYWAEGSKYGQLDIVNSDPILIKFMVEWMRKVFGANYTDMKAHLNIYSQQNDLEIKKFWSDLTNIPLSNFGKTFVKPANKNYKKNTLYYGTIKVRLFKSGDNLHRTFGWVRKFLEDMNIDVNVVKTKWNTLRTEYGRQIPIVLPKTKKMN